MSIAIITGATGDIGRAVAKTLGREGYRVVLFGTGRNKLASLHSELSDNGAKSCYVWGSVSDEPDVQGLVDLALNLGEPVDVLVTAHGAHITAPMPSEYINRTAWDGLHGIDVWGTFHVNQKIGAIMLEQSQGAIVNITSLHALQTYPQRAAYAAAKAAVAGLTRALAVEWAPRGVRVNAIAPGQVEGARTDTFCGEYSGLSLDDAKQRMRARIPTGRLALPQDIADAALFLINTPAMNGHLLTVDGGASASFWWGAYGENASA